MSSVNTLSHIARGVGSLEADIENLEHKMHNADCAYERAMAAEKVAKLKALLSTAETLLEDITNVW